MRVGPATSVVLRNLSSRLSASRLFLTGDTPNTSSVLLFFSPSQTVMICRRAYTYIVRWVAFAGGVKVSWNQFDIATMMQAFASA